MCTFTLLEAYMNLLNVLWEIKQFASSNRLLFNVVEINICFKELKCIVPWFVVLPYLSFLLVVIILLGIVTKRPSAMGDYQHVDLGQLHSYSTAEHKTENLDSNLL